jgi:hypothetical protein
MPSCCRWRYRDAARDDNRADQSRVGRDNSDLMIVPRAWTAAGSQDTRYLRMMGLSNPIDAFGTESALILNGRAMIVRKLGKYLLMFKD